MDLMILDEEHKVLIFAEVKNWGATWQIDAYVDRMVKQLREHDAKIPDVVQSRPHGESYQVKKLLMVAEFGYDSVPVRRREEIRKSLGAGWEVSVIPGGTIEEAGAFIDRMRGN